MPVAITYEQVHALLTELCVDLGYCDALNQCPRFQGAVSGGIDAFTDLVIWVQGLDPKIDMSHRRSVRPIVAEHFASWGLD